MVCDIRDELEVIKLLHQLPKEYIWCEIGRLKSMVERLSNWTVFDCYIQNIKKVHVKEL